MKEFKFSLIAAVTIAMQTAAGGTSAGAGFVKGDAADSAAVRFHEGAIFPTDVNVKDFGAKGDGTSDDTAAIQAAADEAFRFANQMSEAVCWRHYGRHARQKDGPMPRLVFPKGTYRLTGPVFFRHDTQLYGLGDPVVEASSPDCDMFVFQYSYRHHVEGLTMEGGRHQFLVETYNIDSANFTARNCTFRRSSAVDSHNWRLKSINKKEVKKKNGRVGTYMPNPSGDGFVRDPRRNSSDVTAYNNSTLMILERCCFEDCAIATDVTPDGAVFRDLSIVTAVSTGCVFRVQNNLHAYGLSVTVKRPPSANDFAIIDCRGAHSMLVENSVFASATDAGVCLVRSRSTPRTIPYSIILRNLDVACGGCPEGAIVSCQHQTTPEMIVVTDVRDTTGKTVKAVAFEGGITKSDYDEMRFFKMVSSEHTYALAIGRNSPNVDCSLPAAAECFSEDAAGVPHAIPSLNVPVPSAGRVLWGGDYGISADSSGDDTEGMRRLVDEAARHPDSVAVLPPRRITLKGTVTLSGKFTMRAAGVAMVAAANDGLTLFRVADGADVTFEHMIFEGGVQHVICTAKEKTRVVLDCCLSYDVAQTAFVMRSPGANGTIQFAMNGGVAFGPMLYDGNAEAVIAGVWFCPTPPQPPTDSFRSAVCLVNCGRMRYQDVLGVPCVFAAVRNEGRLVEFMNRPGEYRWIDNKGGELHSLHSRFGGEIGGGIPPVYNSKSGKVLIEGSYAHFLSRCTRQTPVFCDEPDADVRMFGVACSMGCQISHDGVQFRYKRADGMADATPRQTMCCVIPRPSGAVGQDPKRAFIRADLKTMK